MGISVMNIIGIHQKDVPFFQFIAHIINRCRNRPACHVNNFQVFVPVSRQKLIPGIYKCKMKFSRMIVQNVFIFRVHHFTVFSTACLKIFCSLC